MRFFVTVKPKSKEERVLKIDDTHFSVCVKAPPHEDKANEAVIKTFARYFEIAPSRIEIVSGHASRRKVMEID